MLISVPEHLPSQWVIIIPCFTRIYMYKNIGFIFRALVLPSKLLVIAWKPDPFLEKFPNIV